MVLRALGWCGAGVVQCGAGQTMYRRHSTALLSVCPIVTALHCAALPCKSLLLGCTVLQCTAVPQWVCGLVEA